MNVLSKFVLKIILELWTSCNHRLQEKADKMESHSKPYIFVGFQKGKKHGFFYSPKENKVFF